MQFNESTEHKISVELRRDDPVRGLLEFKGLLDGVDCISAQIWYTGERIDHLLVSLDCDFSLMDNSGAIALLELHSLMLEQIKLLQL